jgi:hypothetical protein
MKPVHTHMYASVISGRDVRRREILNEKILAAGDESWFRYREMGNSLGGG